MFPIEHLHWKVSKYYDLLIGKKIIKLEILRGKQITIRKIIFAHKIAFIESFIWNQSNSFYPVFYQSVLNSFENITY